MKNGPKRVKRAALDWLAAKQIIAIALMAMSIVVLPILFGFSLQVVILAGALVCMGLALDYINAAWAAHFGNGYSSNQIFVVVKLCAQAFMLHLSNDKNPIFMQKTFNNDYLLPLAAFTAENYVGVDRLVGLLLIGTNKFVLKCKNNYLEDEDMLKLEKTTTSNSGEPSLDELQTMTEELAVASGIHGVKCKLNESRLINASANSKKQRCHF